MTNVGRSALLAENNAWVLLPERAIMASRQQALYDGWMDGPDAEGYEDGASDLEVRLSLAALLFSLCGYVSAFVSIVSVSHCASHSCL